MRMTKLDHDIFVAGQITANDVATAAAAGIRTLINNRPDGEEAGQPSSTEIEAAASANGLGYHHIPVAVLDPGQVEAMAEALAASKGPVLAFCRSGTRSTYLWALARAAQGETGEALAGKAAAAGYDLSPIAQFL